MKIPRYIVLALIVASALTGLAASGWCWVVFPDYTTATYVSLVETRRFDEAQQLVSLPDGWTTEFTDRFFVFHDVFVFRDAQGRTVWFEAGPGFNLKPRTIADLVTGRRRFTCANHPELEFVATRGKILCSPQHLFRESPSE